MDKEKIRLFLAKNSLILIQLAFALVIIVGAIAKVRGGIPSYLSSISLFVAGTYFGYMISFHSIKYLRRAEIAKHLPKN